MTTETTPGSEPSTSGPLTDFDRIPVIDLAGLAQDIPQAKERIAIALRQACTEVGFFYIINHGVPEDLIRKVFSEGKRLFDRPLPDKMAIHVKKSPHQLGYVANGDENANPTVSKKPDIHEAFDFVIDDIQVGPELDR